MTTTLRKSSSLYGIVGNATASLARAKEEAAARNHAPARSNPARGNTPDRDSGEVSHLDLVRALILGQGDALVTCANNIDDAFLDAVDLIANSTGRVVTCGMGKSGLVARKIASTMSSMGTPAFFLHPSEARHGDLGMVTADDVVLMVSNSGETQELLALLGPFKTTGVRLIAIVGAMQSTLSRSSDVSLNATVEREACPLNLAPTTSCLVALSLGDALAVTLSRTRGFAVGDFARIHPRGNRGMQIRTRVRDVMRKKDLPIVRDNMPLSEVIVKMTAGRTGLAIVVDEAGELCGVITDGDLRRSFQKCAQPTALLAREVMTQNPEVISEEASIREAEDLMRQRRIKALLAVSPEGKVRGVIDVFVNR